MLFLKHYNFFITIFVVVLLFIIYTFTRWKKSDYSIFNQDATRDINLLMKFENCDMQTAKDLLYQPVIDNRDESKKLLPKHAVQRQRNDGLIKRSKEHPLIIRGTL